MSNKNQKTILVVDDEVQILSLFQSLLEMEGFDVLVANSCDEGLDLLSKNSISVILSDIRMPVHDGFYFLKKVKELKLDVDFYLISGDLEMQAEEVKKLGAIELFTKPNGFDQFLLKMKQEH